MELLRAVPAAWDDVRLLAGAPRQSVTLARRNGADWYVGSLSATAARTETIRLDFLQAGRSYAARVYQDAPDDGIAVTEQTVTSASELTVPVAANGGYSVTLRPASETARSPR
jgi:alpha-glucosidase